MKDGDLKISCLTYPAFISKHTLLHDSPIQFLIFPSKYPNMKLFSFCLINFFSMTVMAQKPGALTGSYPATKTTDQTDDFFGTEFQTLTDG